MIPPAGIGGILLFWICWGERLRRGRVGRPRADGGGEGWRGG